jgi:hypothetical protein
MARYKPYDYRQTKMLPVRFEEQILPGTFEYTLNRLIDESIDLTVFEARYRNDDGGAPAYDPAVLLKIILLAYSRGITSSRQIERLCRENVLFMAISAKMERAVRHLTERHREADTGDDDEGRRCRSSEATGHTREGDCKSPEVSSRTPRQSRFTGPNQAEQRHGQREREDADLEGCDARLHGGRAGRSEASDHCERGGIWGRPGARAADPGD